jgi:hypothetical protein
MVALYKLLITLTSLILLLASDSVDSTWDDAEGGSIPVPVDKLSWLQVSTCDHCRLWSTAFKYRENVVFISVRYI